MYVFLLFSKGVRAKNLNVCILLQLAEEWNNIRLDKMVSDEDFMATLTELTAVSIVDAYRKYLGAADVDVEVLVSGGGSRNLYLMERISSLATAKLGGGSTVSSHDTNTVIKADSKEANLFALLAYLCVNGIPGNVPACTAARHAAVLGKICPGKNFRSALLL
jgi:anhydro-N-acetylmuramic acid kinase